VMALMGAGRRPAFTLELDEIEETGNELRPHLPDHTHRFNGPTPVPRVAMVAAAKPLSELLVPLTLDALTAVDDKDFQKTLKNEGNLPADFKIELGKRYG